VFPTTVWEDIEAAGGSDPEALERLAQQYRAAILAFIRRRGIEGSVAEDLCHEVFVRLISGKVLAKADAGRGRFRSLLCTVTVRVIQDWSRKQTPLPVGDVDPAELAPDFDQVWVLHLVERSLRRLKETSPQAYDVLSSHLAGQEPDRNKLWIARNKLMALVRREIAVTCRSSREVDEEIVRLTPYLRPAQKAK
jgi:DNA-directed RNA polymerase specialized sigma24 family protein